MNVFFDLIQERRIKVRIMFTQNTNVPLNLTNYHRENEYYLLYYQFIKHAFGLRYCNPEAEENVRLRLFFDKIPDKEENSRAFKDRILGLNNDERFRNNRVTIHHDAVGEIDSKNHVILQCLDIVLGSMQFRLNDKHKVKLPESRYRGKKTIAKEKLYKIIRARINQQYPNFNIGVSTSIHDDLHNRWLHPYRHWRFVPTESETDVTKSKRYKE